MEDEDDFTFDLVTNPAEDPVKLEVIAEESDFEAGKPLNIAIRMEISDGWHSYWKNPGDSGMPLQINWNLPEGFTVSEIKWPAPERFEFEGLVSYGYENEVIFLTEITPPASYIKDKDAKIEATMRWLVCSDSMCLPGEKEISLSQPFITKSSDFFSQARERIPQKSPSLKARHTDSFIEIQLENSTSFEKANFFPEFKQIFDETSVAMLDTSQENQKSSILLKNLESTQASQLKGVLVLYNNNDSTAWEIDLPIEKSNQAIGPQPKDSTEEMNELLQSPTFLNILLAFAFAFIGGLLLNLMPCVLPVISLKVLSFVKMAREDRSLTRKHGLAFFAGVIVSFWVLAGAMLLLQSYGHAIGWGFQLQEPIFVGCLAGLLLIFALSFFGVFEVGTSLTSLAGQAERNSKTKGSALFGSFCSGILATAVATPCSGPFLGTAIGFAVTLPSFLAIAVFTVLGAGMAFPYLVLSAKPSLLRFLPKPGPWMETFKELTGFVMLATVLWLLWVFGAQTSYMSLFMVLGALLLLSFAGWIYGRYCSAIKTKISRVIGSIFALSCGILAFSIIAIASSSGYVETKNEAIALNEWETYSPERVKELHEQGRPVLIDFTAKWCLICQANHLVLSNSKVFDKIQEKNVVKMKADWTRRDPVITEALRQYGRNAVPLYVLTKGNSEEKAAILPQVLTPEIVIDHLNEL